MVMQTIFVHLELHFTSFVHMNSEDVFCFAVVCDAILIFDVLQGQDVCDGARVKPHFAIVLDKRFEVCGYASAVALHGDG